MKALLIALILNIGFLSCQESDRSIVIKDIEPSKLFYQKSPEDAVITIPDASYIENSDPVPAWNWVTNVVKTGSITPNAYANLVVDADGNSFITNYVPTQNHNADIYLAKFNSQGYLEWDLLMGGLGRDHGHDLALDSNGNIWIVGFFQGTAKFGSISLTGDHKYNLVLVKIDKKGQCLNAMKLASNNRGFDYSYGTIGDGQLGGFTISTTENDDIILSGEFERELSFGDIHLVSERRRSAFVAKFDPEGKCYWAVKAETSNWCHSTVLHTSIEGDTYFQSSCADTLFVGDVSKKAGGDGSGDLLIAKINSAGKCEWVRSLYDHRESNEFKRDRATNFKDGNILYFHARPDNVKRFNAQLENTEEGIWLASMNDEGKWLKTFASAKLEENGNGVIWDHTLDGNQNIYLAGTFSGTAYFGERRIENRMGWEGAGFVAQYSAEGICQWVKIIQCEGKILWLRSIEVMNDQLYLTGNYQVRAEFDQFRIETNEPDENVNTIFLANIDLKRP